MKKLILFLFLSTSLFCFGQGKSALKDIQSIKFYGVDYSQVKIFGADESPAQFKDAFRRINELFITEAKKYNVGKQLKKEVTEISLDAVNQVNENIDLTELMTAKREYTLSKEQIKAAINALPIQKTPGVGMVFIAQLWTNQTIEVRMKSYSSIPKQRKSLKNGLPTARHVVSDCATIGQALSIAHSRNYKQ